MEVIRANNHITIREPKTIYFDLPKYVNNNLNQKTCFIIQHSTFLCCTCNKKRD